MNEEENDVKEVVAPTESGTEVENQPEESDDKAKNLAALRKKLLETERERDVLLSKSEPKSEDKPKKLSEAEKIVFDRDVRDVTREWAKKTKLSEEQLAAIQGKVSFKGDEVRSEIAEKLEEVYNSMPDVRAKREKELLERGRRLAMQEFQDDELDIGGGGDVDLAGTEEAPRFSAKEKKWLRGMGVSEEEQKKINKSQDSSGWQEGRSATRKFFSPS